MLKKKRKSEPVSWLSLISVCAKEKALKNLQPSKYLSNRKFQSLHYNFNIVTESTTLNCKGEVNYCYNYGISFKFM